MSELGLGTMRKTKIVCTIGPATEDPEQIKALIQAGMDVARLNFSHGDHDSHRKTLHIIREISKQLGKEIGILQDLCGPKIRLGKLLVPERELKTGERVVLSPDNPSDRMVIPVEYPYLLEDTDIGDRILLADGTVLLKVEEKKPEGILCEVLVGGPIQSHKGLNLPSSDLRVPVFTEKDREDLAVGIEEQVDFVAQSFIHHEQDLVPLRKILNSLKSPPMLIAKIEKPQAFERLGKILSVVDGVMVARGDLGVEMPLEEVPMIQKKIIRMARDAGKPVITATQMLRSMVNNPRPTRAEASDVANAVLDGTDALMLSEETAIGNYPRIAVNILDRIAKVTESHMKEYLPSLESGSDSPPTTESGIGRSACLMAEDLRAAAIVAGTTSGSSARLISRFQPSCPVVGMTPSLTTHRQLTLSWGVTPVLVDSFSDTDALFDLASSWIRDQDLAQKGDRIIITAGVPVGIQGTTNLIKVIELE
jgi:pyruvate kinase